MTILVDETTKVTCEDHAGAIITGGKGGADYKIEAMRISGLGEAVLGEIA